ncbi:hypothetical protein OS493_035372 [Desmophyllum pertusum]|uniref:Uncharacterized protein n=1 Tax=Desmophyllum pertusum TaxID=174260 RepID=A0A9X0D6P5_9CNID|nr:hypothetical protein OS493_035372 [Desmophyllum pertusum]
MSPQAMLCVFILVVCGLIPLIDANAIQCQNLEYTGPIKEVIEMKPTKLAEATDAAAAAAEGFAMDMASAGIGGIPFVGIMLSSMFDQIMASVGSGGLQIEGVFQQFEARDLSAQRVHGPEHRGDSYKERANEMAVCLENLRAMLSQQYLFFMPEGETPSAYEQTLPLFRTYGQLYVDTLLDQIAVEKKKGHEDLAERHAEALIAKVKEFKEHSEKALKMIVMHHLEPHIMPPKNNPSCAPLSDGVGMCVCTIAIGPSKFNAVDKNGIPTDKTKTSASELFILLAIPVKLRFVLTRMITLGSTGRLLLLTGGSRSLPLLERIQFEREVAADIAKEKRMMQKRETAA